jgi:phage terminase large subunit-like protein
MLLQRHLSLLSTTTWLPPLYREFAKLWTDSSPQEIAKTCRDLFRQDLWLLLFLGLNRPDMMHPWLFLRCQEIQRKPDGYLDLWARDHRKSSIITFGKTVQDILASHGDDPLASWHGLEPTFGIFSHTRPIAKAFLRQIKTEFEQNSWLKELFPDVLYARPERESPRWSEDNGLVVRRRSNPKEATVEAWGLVDGQPTGKHFNVLIWDDVVTRDSVTTPEMIQKTTEAWSLSLNLGDSAPRKRAIGTRWHFADSYRTIMDRGALLPRIHPATEDGSLKGKPVLLTQQQFDDKVRDMGPYVASAQLLLNPTVDSKQTFQRDWFRHRFERERVNWEGMTRCLLCDPSSGKKGSDYTTIAVLGHGPDQNTYLLDFLRDRLTLPQRGQAYMAMHRKWRPQHAGYEEYGLQADIQYVQELMSRETYHFEIVPLAGKLSKGDRVNRLIPLCFDGKFWMPDALFRTNAEGKLEDLVTVLIEQEFLPWPVPVHDDGLDVISRKFDMEDFGFPMPDVPDAREDRYNKRSRRSGSWMGA